MIQNYGHVHVFIGVDVGKSEHHAVALDRTGKSLYDKALPNDETKLRTLIRSLKTHGQALIALARRRGDVLYAMLRDGVLCENKTLIAA
jgi:hypothetical protein